MRHALRLLLLIILLPPALRPQARLQEGFEDSGSLPAGWSVWNNAPFPIHPAANWTVRDTGIVPPGISGFKTKAHEGVRSVGVSWWASMDTTGAPSNVADAWLVTPKVRPLAGDAVKFWGTGGNVSFLDSLQVWISPRDSTPLGLIGGSYLGHVIWVAGSVFGQFNQYMFDVSAGADTAIWIGFRYFMNCSVDGFLVQLDDVSVEPATSVSMVDDKVPDHYAISQNYPNPFNPSTTIRFSVREEGTVTLAIYNLLGEKIATLVHGEFSPGTYSITWNAERAASGVYFYRLTAGRFLETHRMVLAR